MIEVSPELLSFLREEYDRCRDDTLEDERETAIDRYNGAPYGDEEDGSSQVVARDTAETVDYMVISILRTIISGDRVVEFMHKNSEAAHEATETIMYMLMDEQDGYAILHDWLKAGLLEKNAIAMTYPEVRPKKRSEVMIPAALMAEQEVLEAEPAGVDPETGEEMFRAIVLQEQDPKFCDAAIPNEEFYCSPDARTLAEAPLKGRKVRKSLSELIELGFPQEEVEGSGPDATDSTLSQARDSNRLDASDQRRGLNRTIWWHEEFVRFDANGDGIAELLFIQRTEDYKVFTIDEMEDDDDQPFVDWSPFPMQHRRIGQSLADKVMDLERVNTVLLRQTLNGIYLGNNPSTYVHETAIGENTIEDLLTVRPGRLVRWAGSVEPKERGANFDPSAGFAAMEFMDRRRESRTGITRLNMGLDEDTLNQTAKGQAQLIARGEQVEEYLARNFANAVARLITKKAKLLQRYGGPIMVPIDGEYVEVDPRKWPEDMIARARVGLGVSRKDQRLMFRREVIGMQAQAMDAGLDIVGEQQLYNSAKGFIADAGLGDVSEYFVEPPKDEMGNPIPKQPKPDPEMMKVQAQIKQKQAELAAKQAESAAKLQLQQAEAQAKLEQMRIQGAQKAQMDAQKLVFDQQIATARAQGEAILAERQMELDAMLEMQKIQSTERSQARSAAFSASAKKYREGGRLDK